ncbi:hypothetical protein ABPG74_015719 [Tetrahymena malaccensis]
MDNQNELSFFSETSKNMKQLLGQKGLFQSYIKELYDETKDETFLQISKYVSINCRYLLKYFGEFKDQFNQCGGRHNEFLTSLYQAHNYLDIDSKVNGNDMPAIRVDKFFVEKGDKVHLKRKILNDYMSIINKRQQIVDDIEENFISLFEMHEGTLQYYNKYYSKQNKKRYQRLLNLLIPQFRYILKFVTNKGRQFETRLRNYSDIKYEKMKTKTDESQKMRSSSIGYLNQSQFAKKKDSSFFKRDQQNKRQENMDSAILDQIEQNYENEKQKYQSILEKKTLMQKQKFEHLAKSKGYFYLENSDNQNKKYDQYEMLKFGTDKMKLRKFEKDMKQIIKENKIQKQKEENEQQNSDKVVENEETKMKRMRKKLMMEKKKKQKELLQNVKETIQNFKRMSIQSQFLQDLLTEKNQSTQKDVKEKAPKTNIQTKTKLTSQQKLQYISRRQSIQSIDFGIDINQRLNSKASLSSLQQLKQYQTFQSQPRILKDDVSFKKFKEKYFFQKDSQNEAEIKPYIQQISTKELKNSNTQALPLTINELKASLVNQFLSINNQNKKNSFSDDEGNASSNKNSWQLNQTINSSFDKKKESFIDPSPQLRNLTEGKRGSQSFLSSIENQQLGQEEINYDEEVPQSINYYSSQQKKKEQKLKQQENYMQSKSQIQSIELPKEDIFIFKKLNKIYLEKYYQEKILNKKSSQNILPLYSLEDLNKVKEKASQSNIKRNSILNSRQFKSVPFISEIFGMNKATQNNKSNMKLPKVADNSSSNQSNKQNAKAYTKPDLVNPPSLEFQELSTQKNYATNQYEQNKKLQAYTSSFQGIATDLDINTLDLDQDMKVITPNLQLTPKANQYFDFNQIKTIDEEEIKKSRAHKKQAQGDQKLSLSKNQGQDQFSSSSSSSVSSNDLQIQQSTLNKQQLSQKVSIQLDKSISKQLKQSSVQKPQHKQSFSLDYDQCPQLDKNNIGKLTFENGDTCLRKQIYTNESQGSPINNSMSTNMSNSQGLLKLLISENQVYPSQNDFVREKNSQSSIAQNKFRNSISFLSTKTSTQSSQNQKRKLNKSPDSPQNLKNSSGNTQNQQSFQDQSLIKNQNPLQKMDQFKHKQNSLSQSTQFLTQKEKEIQYQEQQIKQFSNSISTLNQKIISQQYDLHKLNDKFCSKQKQSSKLFNILNKKYDLCIEKKEKNFNKYIQEINSPLQDQVAIIQKEKLQERLTPFEIFKLEKELKNLDMQKKLEKLNQYSQQSGIESREIRFISKNCSLNTPQANLNLEQNQQNEQNKLPQNAIDLILKLKKSKYFVSPQKAQQLTEKWNQYENQSQQNQSKS